MRILLYPGIEEPWLGQLRGMSPQIEVVVAGSEAEAVALVGGAEAVYGRLTPAMLAAAGKLRWMQSSGIGLEGSMYPSRPRSMGALTRMGVPP